MSTLSPSRARALGSKTGPRLIPGAPVNLATHPDLFLFLSPFELPMIYDHGSDTMSVPDNDVNVDVEGYSPQPMPSGAAERRRLQNRTNKRNSREHLLCPSPAPPSAHHGINGYCILTHTGRPSPTATRSTQASSLDYLRGPCIITSQTRSRHRGISAC